MDHWPGHARQWAQVGAPLRPGPDDVAAAAAAVDAWARAHGRAPRALLLGATPELATMAWPDGTRVTAIDRAPGVLGALYPAAPDRRAAVGDWRALPVAAGAVDVAVGDGALSNLAFPDEYRVVAAELARALAPGGVVALRLFAQPPRPEPLAAVAAALAAGAIGSFHAFKWRVAMAVAPPDRNVRVSDVGRAVDELVPDRAALAARTGWPRATIDTIDVYRGSSLVYSFPTIMEVRAALAPHLTWAGATTPRYELGDRCPTIVWRRA